MSISSEPHNPDCPMNSLQQYIDLYRAQTALVDAGSAPVLNALRPDALWRLERMELPRHGSEDYEHIDLPMLLAPDYGINLARRPLHINPAETFSCRVPNLSTALFFLSGDMFAQAATAQAHIPQGAIVASLRTAAQQHPELVAKYYGKTADMENPLVALNTLLVQDGLFVYVPKGVRIETPLQLVSMLQGAAPMMAIRRLLIVLEEGAEATLLCCDHTQNDTLPFLNLQTVEIYAGAGSHLEMYELEESTRLTTRLSSLYVDIHADANVLLDGMTLYNGTTRNEYYGTFRAPGGELKILGMGIEDQDRRLDSLSLVRHDVPHCHSNQLFKYVVEENAVGAFEGRVLVSHGADKTEAYQANRSLVASPTARMYSKPQLEIYADDVKCSHGTAIGQLDPMQIFYMRTRGLSELSAKTLLRQAFMADVIDPIPLERLRTRLRHLVDMRLDPECSPEACGACHSLNA